MRGRKPKPDALKRLHGTFQPCRARRTAEVPAGELIPSKQLADHERALAYWTQLTKSAPPGLLAPIDAPLLERLCVALALGQQAQDEINAAGGPNPYDRRVKLLVRIADQQTILAQKLASDLALTPQARRFLG